MFLKLAVDPTDAAELRREAEVYELLRHRCPAAAKSVAGSADWAESEGALCLEMIEGFTLAQRAAELPGLASGDAGRLGAIVASLHLEGAPLADDPPESAIRRPITQHRPDPEDVRWLSAGGLDLLPVLQGSESLCAHLDRVSDPGLPDTLIHGDLRLENVIAEIAPPPEDPGLRLVDWEFAGWGEAAWDLACFMGSCLSAWLGSVPQVPGVPPAALIDQAAIPLEAIRPGIGSFWSAYVELRGPGDDRAAGLLARSLDLLGARLVQLAFDATLDDEELRASPVAHLQVALNVLEQPQVAARELMGIDVGDG